MSADRDLFFHPRPSALIRVKKIVTPITNARFALPPAGACISHITGTSCRPASSSAPGGACLTALFAGWHVARAPLPIIVPILPCTVIGPGFSVYPARQAAAPGPIEAIRAE